MKKISICLIFCSTILFPIKALSEPVSIATSIAGSASVGLTLESIKGLVEDSIDKAQNTGDYLLFKGSTELKSVISTWESANKNLIDKTFSELNDSQRKFFNDLNATAQQLNSDIGNHLETTTQIAELTSQIVQDVKIFDGGLALFRYSPRIVYKEMPKNVIFTIRGVNFDKADPQLILPSGNNAKRVSLTKQEAIYTFSNNEFKFKENESEFTNLKLQYLSPSDTLIGKIDDVIRGRKQLKRTEISLLQLPENIGNYTISYTVTEELKEFWKGQHQFHHSGRNSDTTQNQGPHDNGWKMVISSVTKTKEWGEAGHGCQIATNNEFGFSIYISVGKISTLLNPNAPGYQHCIYTWQEYKDYKNELILPEIYGQLKWNTDSAIVIPDNKKSLKLTINTWDGKTKIFNGTATDSFFSIQESNNLILIKPKIPKDLNAF